MRTQSTFYENNAISRKKFISTSARHNRYKWAYSEQLSNNDVCCRVIMNIMLSQRRSANQFFNTFSRCKYENASNDIKKTLDNTGIKKLSDDVSLSRFLNSIWQFHTINWCKFCYNCSIFFFGFKPRLNFLITADIMKDNHLQSFRSYMASPQSYFSRIKPQSQSCWQHGNEATALSDNRCWFLP